MGSKAVVAVWLGWAVVACTGGFADPDATMTSDGGSSFTSDSGQSLDSGRCVECSCDERFCAEGASCGDSVCSASESCYSCATDCGECQTPECTSQCDVPLLTQTRLETIRRSIAVSPEAYDAMVQRLEPYVSGQRTINDFENIIIPLALRVAVDAETPASWEQYFKVHFLQSVENFNYQHRNTARAYMANFAYGYSWVEAHGPADFWSESERARILGAFETWLAWWVDHFDNSPWFYPQDSDETTMMLENTELYAYVLPAGNVRDDIVRARDLLVELVETRYLDAEVGTFGGGFWNESPSYNANTPRFYLRWHQLYLQRGETPADPAFPVKLARQMIHVFMADPSLGHLLFNDPLALDTGVGGPLSYPASSFRTHNMLANVLIGTAGTPEAKVVRDLLNRLPEVDAGGEFYHGAARVLGEDATLDLAASAETLGLDRQHFAAGAAFFAARSDWSTTASQLFSTNWGHFEVDHMNFNALHFEIYKNGQPISKYGVGIGFGGEAASGTPMNTVYIEGRYANDFFINTGSSRRKGLGKNLGAFSGRQYTTVTWDAKDLHNLTGWEQTANFARQATRSILHFWDGVTLVYDRVQTDPDQVDDIDAQAPYTRQTQKLTRFEGAVSYQAGFYHATAHGLDHWYKPLLGDATIRVVDETLDEPWSGLADNSFFPSHRSFHLEESQRSLDAEYFAMHVWGDQGVALPEERSVFVTEGDAVVHALRVAGRWRVVLFNRDPEQPIRSSVSVRVGTEFPMSGVDVYAVGWRQSMQFQVSAVDGVITLSPGGTGEANAGGVLEASY